jgi:hypothetical protein
LNNGDIFICRDYPQKIAIRIGEFVKFSYNETIHISRINKEIRAKGDTYSKYVTKFDSQFSDDKSVFGQSFFITEKDIICRLSSGISAYFVIIYTIFLMVPIPLIITYCLQ